MPLSLNDIDLQLLRKHFPAFPKPSLAGANEIDDPDLNEMTVALSPHSWEDVSVNLADLYAQDLTLFPFEVCNYYFPGFLLCGIGLAKSSGDVTILYFLQCLYDKNVEKSRATARINAFTDGQRKVVSPLIASDLSRLNIRKI